MVVEEKWQRYIIEYIETINNEIIELKSLFIMLFVWCEHLKNIT